MSITSQLKKIRKIIYDHEERIFYDTFYQIKTKPYLWTSIVSIKRTATQAQRRITWSHKSMIPMKNPVPRIMVSRGCAYSASIPNGA